MDIKRLRKYRDLLRKREMKLLSIDFIVSEDFKKDGVVFSYENEKSPKYDNMTDGIEREIERLNG